jgi:hypothetical protein
VCVCVCVCVCVYWGIVRKGKLKTLHFPKKECVGAWSGNKDSKLSEEGPCSRSILLKPHSENKKDVAESRMGLG